MTRASVSVVVCAYTTLRWAQLQAALTSVAAQSDPPEEIVLVVDHCPELLARAERLPGTSPTSHALPLRVVENEEAPGLSGARNTGMRAAHGEIVAFLDDDAVADPRWLAELVAPFGDPAVVGTGGRILPAWVGGEPDWFPPEFRWVVGCTYAGMPASAADVRNPIGASMAFRRRCALDAGGFSARVGRIGSTPLGCEETELAIRLAQQVSGARIVYEPRSVVRHHVGAERARWVYFRRRCWAEGLSKAQVARLSDPRRALSTERRYVLHTLPSGIARDVRQALGTRRAAPLRRVAASAAGLGITAAGYALARARSPHTPHPSKQPTGSAASQIRR